MAKQRRPACWPPSCTAPSLDPTIVIGGRLTPWVLPLDWERESLLPKPTSPTGSFMLLDPTVAVITNIDPEHLEHWGSMDALVDGFCAFRKQSSIFRICHPVPGPSGRPGLVAPNPPAAGP